MPVTLLLATAHLWRDKVGGVAGGHEQAVVGAQLLREAKVADVQALRRAVHVGIQQVGRLEVTVNYLRRARVVRDREHGDANKMAAGGSHLVCVDANKMAAVCLTSSLGHGAPPARQSCTG